MFDILIDYHGISEAAMNLESKEDVTFLGEGMVKFDMEIHLTEVEKGVNFVIRYNSDIYEREMMEQFVVHYKNLLQTLLENPDVKISEANFLTKESAPGTRV